MVRLKSRFLVLRLAFKDGRPGGEPSTEAALTAALKTALIAAFGDAGAAAAASGAVSVRWMDPAAGVAVVRCGREGVAQLHAVVALLTDLCHRAVVVHTVRVCGRVSTAQRAARALLASLPPPAGKAAAKAGAEAAARLDGLTV